MRKKKAKTIQKKWLLLCPFGKTNNFTSFQSSYFDRKSLQCRVTLLPPESCINDEHRTRPIPHVTYISDPKYNLRGCMRLSSLHQEVTDLFLFRHMYQFIEQLHITSRKINKHWHKQASISFPGSVRTFLLQSRHRKKPLANGPANRWDVKLQEALGLFVWHFLAAT